MQKKHRIRTSLLVLSIGSEVPAWFLLQQLSAQQKSGCG
jgi:hypothetical protein